MEKKAQLHYFYEKKNGFEINQMKKEFQKIQNVDKNSNSEKVKNLKK